MARVVAGGRALRRVLLFAAVVLCLNTLLTFTNRAPTVWPRATLGLSLELFAGLGLMALLAKRNALPSRRLRLLFVLLFGLAVVLRYVDVTVPGALGRELDLRGDLPHVLDVAGMFRGLFSSLAVLSLALLLLLLVGLLLAALWWLFARLEEGLQQPAVRRGVGVALLVVSVLFVVDRVGGASHRVVAEPLVLRLAYHLDRLRPSPSAHEVERALREPGPQVDLDLGGAHVLLIFLESYGTTLIEDDQHLPYIAPRYRRLASRLAESRYAVRSTKILSPTFGGGSWRAHASLLSGLRLESQALYELFLDSERRTLVHLLADSGYRTVAVEPGIRGAWPEGEQFDFDRIYDAEGLSYAGREIGWWKIPDQFTLYGLVHEELEVAERPIFAKVSLITTHIPYTPVPPYVEDWSRFADGTAYTRSLPSIAADDYRDLQQLSSRYVHSFLYALDVLEGFLVDLVPENSLVIVCGDHQPPKLATHTNSSWAVPIHLFSRRPELVEPFADFGFEEALVPSGRPRLGMEDFLAAFVSTFGVGGSARSTPARVPSERTGAP